MSNPIGRWTGQFPTVERANEKRISRGDELSSEEVREIKNFLTSTTKQRSKSALLPPAEVAKAEEPLSGAGSSCCFCRVMDRRARAQEAHQVLREGQGGQIAGQDGARFAYFEITDLNCLQDMFIEMKRYVASGEKYSMQVRRL
jgi:hypothetical protein